MRYLKIAGLICGVALAVGFLGSCATLDENQCQTVDWRALGQEDGLRGRPMSFIDRHREACSKHKLPVQDAIWHEGWTIGIRSYCTPRNGLNEGRNGQSYANSCPIELKAQFEDAYSVGKRVHEAEASLARTRNEIERLIRAEAAAKTPQEVNRIRQEISLRRSDLFRAETRVKDAEREYDRYMRSLRE